MGGSLHLNDRGKMPGRLLMAAAVAIFAWSTAVIHGQTDSVRIEEADRSLNYRGRGRGGLLVAAAAAIIIWLGAAAPGLADAVRAEETGIPPSWKILPIPRWVDYGSPDDFITLGKVAVVRKTGSPYETQRDEKMDLVGGSTITEEELKGLLNDLGLSEVTCLPEDGVDYGGFDTLILLGPPEQNALTARFVDAMGLSFERWDDPNSPGDDFTQWSDFGREGYLLKVGRSGGQNIVILAGYDRGDLEGGLRGAGTFYAMQSFRQLIVGEGKGLKIKTAEIADKPLVGVRGCYTGFVPVEEYQWRDIAMMARMKANANVYWYGNAMAGYNSEAASRFRYPWKPEQLDLIGRIGRWCREHFIMMVFCMNADHYSASWAAPRSFDGKRQDPCHYDPDYEVEPEFKEMWADVGYAVKNDADILAAKFAQLNEAVGGGAIFQPMNEDEVFGLIHEEDKELFKTDTGDQVQDAVNYGRARGLFVASLYKRVRRLCPDSSVWMPMDPPASLPYQRVIETNENNSRVFLKSMSDTFREQGVLEYIPMLTTGGGTLAEVLTNKQIDDYKRWCNGAPVLLHENNIPTDHMGAYETDRNAPRSLMQLSDSLQPGDARKELSLRLSEQYPAGYRDKELYKRLWGIEWNGMNVYGRAGQYVLAWSEMTWMWNMAAMDRGKVNALAVRKVSDSKSYPLVKAFFEEFDRPIGYLPDEGCPDPPLILSNRIAFPGRGWNYVIEPRDDMRLECQRLKDKLARLIPELDARWHNERERVAAFKWFGYKALNFCTLYLARGYAGGWKGCESTKDMLTGEGLRDLYLQAEEIQQRFFAGPEIVPGANWVCHNGYHDPLRSFYTGERLGPDPGTPKDAKYHEDFWTEVLQGEFFDPLSSIAAVDLAESSGWGKVEEADGEKFRTVTGEASARLTAGTTGRILVRIKIGTRATSLADCTNITLSAGEASHEDGVCKPRWLYWLLPDDADASRLTIKTAKPVRVYCIEVHETKSPS